MPRPPLETRPCKLCGEPIAFIETTRSKFDRLSDPNLKKRYHVVDAKPVRVAVRSGNLARGYTLHRLTCSAMKAKRVEGLTTGEQS